MQARRICEEAKVVRSIDFPVPICVLSLVREAKLCPTDRAFVCSNRRFRGGISAAVDKQAATPAKTLFTNNFQAVCPERASSGITLGGPSFQKIKQPLRANPVFDANCFILLHFVHRTKFLTLLCDAV
jgi:hypothetical protein